MHKKKSEVRRKKTNIHQHGVTGIELLTTFHDAVVADEPELNFDFLGFWAMCANFLTEMRNVVDRPVCEQLGVAKPAFDSQFAIYLMLQTETVKRAGYSARQSMIGHPREMLQRLIHEQGDEFTRTAYERSSGIKDITHIPRNG
jgi:hypothetical protein